MSLLKQSKYYAYSQAIPIDSEQHPDDRIRRRMCSTYSQSSTTTSALSSRPAIFELLFAKLLDALIFTSAIAITAYNYLMGALDNSPNTPQPAPIVDIKQWRQANTAYRLPSPTTATTRIPEHHHQHHHDFLQDSKRERTLQWAETVARTTSKPRSVQLPPRHQQQQLAEATKHKRRTQSMPPPPPAAAAAAEHHSIQGAQVARQDKEDDEMFARMEERLQSLIQEGQAALTSKVELYELDENEIAMRKSFAAARYHA